MAMPPTEDPRALSGEFLKELRLLSHTDSLAWQLETVKHLAVINGAGLASAAAVVASTSMESLRFAATVAAALCAIGLVIAVALMYWRWIWGTLQARQITGLLLAAKHRTVSIDEVANLQLRKFWRYIAFSAAGLSLCGFIVGMVVVIFSATTMPAKVMTAAAPPHIALPSQPSTASKCQ